MADCIVQVNFAGHPLRYSLRYPWGAGYFGVYLERPTGREPDLRSSDARMAAARRQMPGMPDSFVEYRSLIGLTALNLLRWDCCLFHAAAFLWRGRAWLLTGPSGTGKTTQFLNWQRQFPGEITMLCGDMPALERREDGSVWVHPSPWNGKEGFGSRVSAPLGGLVVLEQGSVNQISRPPVRELIAPVFAQFLVGLNSEDVIRGVARLADAMLRTAPAWNLVNLGDAASTALLRETLSKEIGACEDAV